MTGLSPDQLAFMASVMEANDRVLTFADLAELEQEERVARGEEPLTMTDVAINVYRAGGGG